MSFMLYVLLQYVLEQYNIPNPCHLYKQVIGYKLFIKIVKKEIEHNSARILNKQLYSYIGATEIGANFLLHKAVKIIIDMRLRLSF